MTEAPLAQARIAEAVVELMVEDGYGEMTIAAVADRAGVDRADFDRHFESLESCVLEVYWEYTDAFTDLVFAAYEEEGCWREGFRAAAYTAARWIRDNPRVVRFGTVQMFEAGLMAQAQRASHLQRMVDLVDAGRQELDDPNAVGRAVAEGAFGSIYEFMVKEVSAGHGTRAAEEYVPELMYIAVRPYLGDEVARQELKIPPPEEPVEPSKQTGTETEQAVQGGDSSRYGPAVSKGERSGDEAALRLARLPPGRHGLPREFVTQNQRDRLAAGTIAVVAERGLNDATITQICAAAGVSRRTFYVYFSSKEECFFAAYDTIVEHLGIATDAASSEQSDWPGRVAAKLRATLEFLAANPDLARFCLIAPQRAGEGVASRYRDGMGKVVAYLCEGMPAPPATKVPSAAVAVSLIGGMVALVVRKVDAGEGDALPELLPDLLELFLTPYLGRAEAVRIAQSSL
jgi:AcrR family transcriptional regulator